MSGDPLHIENAIAREVILRYITSAVHQLGGVAAFVRLLTGKHIHSTVISSPDGTVNRAAVKFTIEIDDSPEAIREAMELGGFG